MWDVSPHPPPASQHFLIFLILAALMSFQILVLFDVLAEGTLIGFLQSFGKIRPQTQVYTGTWGKTT